jgi:phospholipid transport system substrate-binding protein
MTTRRTFITSLFAVMAAPAMATAAGDHPSITYMKQVAKDMLVAHRQGTVAAFMRVIQRHADVPEISQHALGKYNDKLPSSQRAKYQKGVATYMSRYFALQSRDYTVAKYIVGEATVDDNKDVIVSSKVYLMSGQVYNVSWKLVWRGGRYKVRDASVLGFWLTNFQRKDFTDYLAKRNGNVNQLISALYG